jgi:hypothetical protein
VLNCDEVQLAEWPLGENITDRDIVELVLGMDTAAHSSEDEDISAQNDSDTDCGTDEDLPHVAF